MTSDDITRHMDLVRELSKPGQALAGKNPATATVNNPDWWNDGRRTPARRDLHRRLLMEAREDAPHVEQQRRAIILAGPPGAGKGDAKHSVLGEHESKFLNVDADEFKEKLLRHAIADGSYESWIKPDAIRELEQAGEQFFPMELASLVHEESSYLAKALRAAAIADGDNIVIDTVLSNEADAIQLGQTLHAAGYDVRVIDVEVPFELSEQRIRDRWELSYTKALEGGHSLGGRWFPSEYARDVFSGPNGRSRPEVAARALAEKCPAVSRILAISTVYVRPRRLWDGRPGLAKATTAATAIGGLLLFGSIMTGCTAEAMPPPSPTVASSASPSVNPTPTPTDVVHYVPDGEDIFASVDNQQASNQIGVFPVTQKNAVVYLTCTGEGTVVIEIDPLGAFPLECAATGAASENQFQVSEYTEIRVGIRSEVGQTWAATITTRD